MCVGGGTAPLKEMVKKEIDRTLDSIGSGRASVAEWLERPRRKQQNLCGRSQFPQGCRKTAVPYT